MGVGRIGRGRGGVNDSFSRGKHTVVKFDVIIETAVKSMPLFSRFNLNAGNHLYADVFGTDL